MLMNKGAIDTAKQLILLIIIVILVVFLMFKYIPQGFANLWNQLLGIKTEGLKAYSLDAAISCSYYRCIEGCNSDGVKNSNVVAYGEDFNCSRDFCKLEWQDSGGKICDDNAKSHPVVVSMEEGMLSKEDLDFAKCIFEVEKPGEWAVPDFVTIDKAIKKNILEEEACGVEGVAGGTGIKKANIGSGTYYIWTYSKAWGGWGQTVVWSQTP
jgi:hypothetical protein